MVVQLGWEVELQFVGEVESIASEFWRWEVIVVFCEEEESVVSGVALVICGGE